MAFKFNFTPRNAVIKGEWPAAFLEELSGLIVDKLQKRIEMEQRLLEIHTAAKYLGMPEAALCQKVYLGLVPHVKIDGRLRFDRVEVDRWIDSHRHEVACGRL